MPVLQAQRHRHLGIRKLDRFGGSIVINDTRQATTHAAVAPYGLWTHDVLDTFGMLLRGTKGPAGYQS